MTRSRHHNLTLARPDFSSQGWFMRLETRRMASATGWVLDLDSAVLSRRSKLGTRSCTAATFGVHKLACLGH